MGRIVLESQDGKEGWCYLCASAYPLDDIHDLQIVYTRTREPDKPLSDTTIPASETAAKDKPRWRRAVKWVLLTIVGSVITYLVIEKAIPVLETPFADQTSSIPEMTSNAEAYVPAINLDATAIASPTTSANPILEFVTTSNTVTMVTNPSDSYYSPLPTP